ncbi:unnamed protein product [Scytosiphon promiscuus]
MGEERRGLTAGRERAADPSANERADMAAFAGNAGSTASPATEKENADANENGNEIDTQYDEPKPNVFFILIDDMGWNDMGYQSMDMQAVTPNLNRMANSGIKLPHYYSQALCTPARAALMTGRYPIRYGFQYLLIFPGAPWGLPLEEKLLPEYLNDNGYTCHMAGKWHLGGHTFDYMPHNRGFETTLSYTYGAETYWAHQLLPEVVPVSDEDEGNVLGVRYTDIGFGNSTDYYHVARRSSSSLPTVPHAKGNDCMGDRTVGTKATAAAANTPSLFSFSDAAPSSSPSSSSSSSSSSAAESVEWYSTDMFTARTLEILKDKTPFDEKPLFMYLAHQAVHSPLGPPPLGSFTAEEMSVLDALDEDESSIRLRFAKVLMYLDKSIGQLMKHLEDQGWMDNSIVVVASDNGGCALEGGSNFPLRGVKMSNWEGGTRVPAFVYSRSHIPEELWGTEYEGLMHVTDWLPTLAAAAGIELSGSRGDLDGVNHWEHIVGSSTSSPGNDEDGIGVGVGGGGGGGNCDGGNDGDCDGDRDGDGVAVSDDGHFHVELEDPDGSTTSGTSSSSANRSITYGPRNEMLYNYDPYFLGAAADRTPSDPDYAQAQGAFRQGKWKFLFKECCLGYDDSHSNDSVVERNGPRMHQDCQSQENASGEETPEGGQYCYGCTGTCVDEADCKDWLFDLEEDPTEEHNLASVYPEASAIGCTRIIQCFTIKHCLRLQAFCCDVAVLSRGLWFVCCLCVLCLVSCVFVSVSYRLVLFSNRTRGKKRA